MIALFILSTSICFQFITAILALRLIKITCNRWSWILISSAIILMGVRRCITLFRFLTGETSQPPDSVAEGVALLISGLMMVGVYQIHNYFQQINSAEEERQKTELLLARFGRILDNSFNEIYIFDGETLKFTQVNSGARNNLNYSMEELTHLTPLDLKPGYTQDDFEELIAPLKSGQKPLVVFETMHQRKDGTCYPVEIRLQWMKEESPPIFVAIIQDIAKRKKDEQRLSDYAEELKRSNKELEDFAFIASHDLQGPLRKIITFGDLIQEQEAGLDEQNRNYLTKMRKATLRMKNLIEDLLHYSQINTEQAPYELVDLEKKVASACEEFEQVILTTQAVIHTENLPLIEGNKSQLQQLFTNLIGNSLKYSQAGKAPVINIFGRKKEDGYWEINVEDNGIGFDEKYTELIFQPFQRLHGKSKYEGSGIGLSICKKIVDHHKGTLSVTSKPGEGTTFTITLPAQQPLAVVAHLPNQKP